MGRFLTPTPEYDTIWQRERYSKRPVWEYLTFTASAGQLYRAAYGADDSINVIEIGSLSQQVNGRTRGWLRGNDESAQHSPIIGVTTANPLTTNAWAPNSGRWGITGFGDTATCNNWYSSTLEYSYINGADAANVMRYSIPAVLPQNENRNFEMTLNGALLKITPIGASWALHVNNNHYAGVTLTSLSGFNSTGHNKTNNGMGCYNARTGYFVAMYRIGTSGANYRLHYFPVGKYIRATTTPSQLRDMFAQSMSGYFSRDVTFEGVTNTGNLQDNTGHIVVGCDDGTLWVCVTDTASNKSGGQGLRIYKVPVLHSLPNSTSSIAMFVQSATNAAHYGLNAGAQYKTRFMSSDDNDVMAVYTHHYYYLCGAQGRFLSTRSTEDTEIGCRGFSHTDTTGYGYSIAPAGGKKFVMGNADNKDSAACLIWFLDPVEGFGSSQTGVNTAAQSAQGAYPQYPTSAMYQAQLVNKIQNVSRFKGD